MARKNTTPTFPVRVRFNWGFHDATADVERGTVRDVSGHFDWAYRDGYIHGQAAMIDATERPASSEDAWKARS